MGASGSDRLDGAGTGDGDLTGVGGADCSYGGS